MTDHLALSRGRSLAGSSLTPVLRGARRFAGTFLDIFRYRLFQQERDGALVLRRQRLHRGEQGRRDTSADGDLLVCVRYGLPGQARECKRQQVDSAHVNLDNLIDNDNVNLLEWQAGLENVPCFRSAAAAWTVTRINVWRVIGIQVVATHQQ